MDLYNLGVGVGVFDSVLDTTKQNKNKPLFRKNISPQLSFLTFVFNLHLFCFVHIVLLSILSAKELSHYLLIYREINIRHTTHM